LCEAAATPTGVTAGRRPPAAAKARKKKAKRERRARSCLRSMENLTGAKRDLACRVLHEKYKQCVKRSLISDVFASADFTAPTRKCALLFSDLGEHCKDVLPQSAGFGGGK
jgi:hypothetical protein